MVISAPVVGFEITLQMFVEVLSDFFKFSATGLIQFGRSIPRIQNEVHVL